MNELPSLAEYVKHLTEHGNTVIIIDQNKIWDKVADYEVVFSEQQEILSRFCGSK